VQLRTSHSGPDAAIKPGKTEHHDPEDLPAQQFAPQAQTRLSRAHGHKAGPRRSVAQARPRPQETFGLISLETLKKRSEYRRTQKGCKWVTPAFILQALERPETHPGTPRFGFTVSSKAVSKAQSGERKRGIAADRNRARRRLREAVRLSFPAHARPGFDYVITGRSAALTRNFAVLLADMETAFHKVNKPARSGGDRSPMP
jgi:ribonuclease P protein component